MGQRRKPRPKLAGGEEAMTREELEHLDLAWEVRHEESELKWHSDEVEDLDREAASRLHGERVQLSRAAMRQVLGTRCRASQWVGLRGECACAVRGQQ